MKQKRTIVIIEFDYHSEVLRNSLLILQDLSFKIYLFTSAKIWDSVNSSAKLNNVIVFKALKNRDVKKLILSNLETINRSDLIVFNTLASHFKLFSSIDFKPPVVLRIHNVNTYLNAAKSINPKFSFFYIWKDTSYLVLHGLFKLEMFYRSKFIKENVNYFLFPTYSVKNFALKHGYVKREQILPPIPYVFMKNRGGIKTTKTSVNIVIIGSIDKRRRNYREVLNVFKLLVPNLNTKIIFSLLGKPSGLYGKQIIKAFIKLETNLFKVNTFKKFVSQTIFDEITEQADFLIIPTVKETRYKLYKELYGYTKISGNINDMVIYKKPALIPAFYPIDESLKPYVGTYRTQQELKTILENWIDKRAFEAYTINSVIDEYNFENVAKSTFKSLNEIVTSKD